MAREKKQISVRFSEDVVERLQNMAWWERVSLQEFIEGATLAALEASEARNGGVYKVRKSDLPHGRRPGT
jgi:hypothetical protein